MSSNDQMRKRVRDVLIKAIPYIDPALSDDDDIYSTGVDSVNIALLITGIEKEFSLSLDDDMPYEKFRTITEISAYLESLMQNDGNTAS